MPGPEHFRENFRNDEETFETRIENFERLWWLLRNTEGFTFKDTVGYQARRIMEHPLYDDDTLTWLSRALLQVR